jgi:hypothetical protein
MKPSSYPSRIQAGDHNWLMKNKSFMVETNRIQAGDHDWLMKNTSFMSE